MEMAATLLELYRKNPEKFRAFLFDIDGTVLLANTPIPGATEFLDILRKDHVPFFFLTNNCAQTHEEIAQRLTKAGIYAEPDEVISSYRRINPKRLSSMQRAASLYKKRITHIGDSLLAM